MARSPTSLHPPLVPAHAPHPQPEYTSTYPTLHRYWPQRPGSLQHPRYPVPQPPHLRRGRSASILHLFLPPVSPHHLRQSVQRHFRLDRRSNTVIQIQDTKFKLHQSQLAKHSEWFSNLLDGNEVVGGKYVERGEDGTTPMYIITLPTLNAKDFARLLDGFDRAITYVHEDPSFHRIAGILRASTCLSFPDFTDWAIRVLEDKWSSELADLSTEPITYATESVVLARLCGISSILKRAMYELVRLAGYGQTDRENVSTRDVKALIKAREELTSLWMMTMSPYSPDLATCASTAAPADPVAPKPPIQCTTANPLLSGKAHHKLVKESGIADDYLYDPLCGLKALIDVDWGAEGYCEKCVNLRRDMWGKRREKVWDNLNIWFGLEDTA
ncbi:hypothetical protein B0H10DRAFT_734300 [Mycena sp. CBHHK59/15]|nr:hypothetical protein B0H10DRAFT_734300 [Mycena sp. CBHHK59/15]